MQVHLHHLLASQTLMLRKITQMVGMLLRTSNMIRISSSLLENATYDSIQRIHSPKKISFIFFCILHLIVETNSDHVAHKAMFSRIQTLFMIQLVCGEPINLSRQIFKRIHYKSTTLTTNNLFYGEIISKLLLDNGVQARAQEC